jgi:hypothetical protein
VDLAKDPLHEPQWILLKIPCVRFPINSSGNRYLFHPSDEEAFVLITYLLTKKGHA